MPARETTAKFIRACLKDGIASDALRAEAVFQFDALMLDMEILRWNLKEAHASVDRRKPKGEPHP